MSWFRRTIKECPSAALLRSVIRAQPHSEFAGRLRQHALKCSTCAPVLEEAELIRLLDGIASDAEHPDSVDLSFFLDTKEEDPARRPIREHLDTCVECRHRVERMTADRIAGETAPVYPDMVPSAPRRPAFGGRWKPIFVTAGSLAVLVAVLWWPKAEKPSKQIAQRPAPALQQPQTPVNPPVTSQGRPVVEDRVVSVFPDGRVTARAPERIKGILLTMASRTLATASHPTRDWNPPGGELRSVLKSGSDESRVAPPKLISPVNRVVADTRVTFRWKPAAGPGVASHTLEVKDFYKTGWVQSFPKVPSGKALALPPGRLFIWTVIAKDADDVPVASSDAWLHVMESDVALAIRRNPDAHLTRGLLYESQGAWTEALAEYRLLQPDSRAKPFVDRLVRRVRAQMEADFRRLPHTEDGR